MTWLRVFIHRLRGLFLKRRLEQELDEEIRAHLEMQIEDNLRQGMSPDEARYEALRKFGGVEQVKERYRDRRSLAIVDSTLQDLRYALRSLRRSPVFTAVALLTLALGIGANTAIFSVVNGVILRPLGYPKPEQLMYLSTRFSGVGIMRHPVSPPEYFEFREFNRSFADVGAYLTGEVNLTAGDRALRVRSATVDGHLLSALAIQPEQGRLFAGGETYVNGPWFPGHAPPAPAIVILSHELWQTAFGGQPIVGKAVEVDGRRCEVVGIMPPGADIMDNRAEIWMPLGLNPANRQFRGYHVLNLVGRLKDGVTMQAAQTELNALVETWGGRVGVTVMDGAFAPLGQPFAHILQMEPMQDVILGGAGRSIWVLQAAVGLVLLIACANLANLLLARAETRHREFAVRAALGASRGRLLIHLLAEALLLSIAGGILGLFLAKVGVQTMIRGYPTSLPRMSEVTVDLSVLLFTLGVSTGTGLLFGLAPFARMRLKDLATALTEGGTRGIIGPARHGVRRGLVIAEVALAVILVIGAGLLARTVYNLTNVDAGFDRSRLVTFSITTPSMGGYTKSARAQMYQRLLDAFRAAPGVQLATAASGLPPARPHDGEDSYIDNYSSPDGDPTPNIDNYQSAMSDYFETMGIPIVQGRSFQPTDANPSGMVAIVNEALANKFWRGQNPIGRRLRPGWAEPWFTVIGVARDVKQAGLDQKTGTELYLFVDQMANAPSPLGRAPETINMILRTTLPAAALSQTVKSLVHEMDPAIPVAQLREMDDVFAESIRRPRLLAELVGVFAGLALLLAVIGAYGVLSYMIVQRHREIGIRLALGATRSSVLFGVMKQGLLLTTCGVFIGLVGALALNRLMASLLFGVQPSDIPTMATAIATITLVAAIACLLPAWRASRVDPLVALKYE
jgi:predicted permease